MYNNVDLFDLERFVKAQDTYDSYNIALKEIKDGWKQSHWMWYVFPQIHGLGHSSTSQKFSIKSLLSKKQISAAGIVCWHVSSKPYPGLMPSYVNPDQFG